MKKRQVLWAAFYIHGIQKALICTDSLTDLMMPEANGYELLAYVRKNRQHIPVIVMTGDLSVETAQRTIQLGARQCIKKPFHLADVVDTITQQLV